MQIGFARTKIDPKIPCHLEGYQDRMAQGYYSHLYMNTIYIQANKNILFHVLDVVIIEKKLYEDIKQFILDNLDVDIDYIFISAIHTHSGPKVSHKIDKEIVLDDEYLQSLKKAALLNTKEAILNKQEARTFLSVLPIENLYSNRNGINKPFFNQAYLLSFCNLNGDSIVDLVNLACHPTILKGENCMVSSDYVGYMRECYELKTGIPLCFFNAEAGDVSTRLVKQGEGIEECKRVGEAIAHQLTNAKKEREILLDKMVINSIRYKNHYYPNIDDFIVEMRRKLDYPDKYFKKNDQRYFMSERLKQSLDRKLAENIIYLDYEAFVVEFNDIYIVTIPGELVYQLAKKIRQKTKKDIILFCYTNDYFGYAINMEDYGLYFESYESEFRQGEAEKFINKIIQYIQ